MKDENKLDKKSMYVNNIGVNFGLFDFSFKLKMNNPDGESDDEMNIFMSPQHAKSFANILLQSVKEYEKIFGEINLNPRKEMKIIHQEKKD